MSSNGEAGRTRKKQDALKASSTAWCPTEPIPGPDSSNGLDGPGGGRLRGVESENIRKTFAVFAASDSASSRLHPTSA